jgi:ATP-binding cassette subfamily C protein CydC
MNKIFFKVVSLASQYKYWMALAVLMGFFTVGSGVGLMMTSAYLISKAALQTPIYQLQVAIVGVRFFGISRGVFRYLERLISHETTFKLLAKFRVWFFKSLVPLIPSTKIDFTSGDLLSRVVDDVESLEHIFVRVISPIFIFVLVAFTMFAILSSVNLLYSVLFLVLFISSATFIPMLTYFLSKRLGKEIVLLKSQLKDFVVDNIQGLSEILIYNQQSNREKEFSKIQDRLLKAEYKMNLIQPLHEGLTGFAMNFTVALMLFIAIPNVTRGLLDGVYLAVISIGIMASFEIVFQLPIAFQFYSKSVAAAKRLFEITEQEIDVKREREISFNEINNYDLSVRDISFSYDDKKDTLSNITFDLKENEKLAIVGVSGVGKSTLINILSGFWKINKGEILIGNNNYNNLSEETIRNIISVVPQKIHLFAGTIKENLLIAKSDASDKEINYLLQRVDLLNKFESFPQKLDTQIGELGNKLSGGEIKRLGIVRALLHNSPILIFDEVTSHLDPINEENILAFIEKVSDGKGIIFITHRLKRMQMFDEILVLSDGKIIERGKHKELLTNDNLYYRLNRAYGNQLKIN